MMQQYYFADDRHIAGLVSEIRGKGLSTPDGMDLTDLPGLVRVYNGIGPDAWAEPLRRISTALLARFEPEALIHDWEYTHQPKTYWAFTWANIRFAWNAFLCAFRTADTRKKLLAQTAAGLALATLCQIWGWTGYRTASLTDQ